MIWLPRIRRFLTQIRDNPCPASLGCRGPNAADRLVKVCTALSVPGLQADYHRRSDTPAKQ